LGRARKYYFYIELAIGGDLTKDPTIEFVRR